MADDSVSTSRSSQDGAVEAPGRNAFDPEAERNTQKKLATVFLCDDSLSTKGGPIDQINRNIELFVQELTRDEIAAETVELAIVSFGGGVDVLQDFVKAGDFQPPTLSAGGNAPIGDAVLKALDMVEDRKSTYRREGYDLFRPWILLFTDGKPKGGNTSIDQAAKAIAEAEREEDAIFWVAGTENADFDVLETLSQRSPTKISTIDYSSIFRMPTAPLKTGNRQDPGDTIQVIV